MTKQTKLEKLIKNSNNQYQLIKYAEPLSVVSCKVHGHFNVFVSSQYNADICPKCMSLKLYRQQCIEQGSKPVSVEKITKEARKIRLRYDIAELKLCLQIEKELPF